MSEPLQERLQDDMKEYFSKIQADEILKTHTRAFVTRKAYMAHAGALRRRRITAAFACLLLLFLIGGGHSFFTLASTISVDVNPSIELGINRYDRVISVKAFNEEGNALIAANDIRFLDYRDALHVLLQTEDMAPYFTQDSLIGITVFGTNDQKTNEMLKNVTSCTLDYDNVHCSSGDSQDVREAHAHGMSCGKYRAYLTLQSLDPSVTTEDAESLTMRQIWDRINELSGNSVSEDAPTFSGEDDAKDRNPNTQKEESDKTAPANSESCGSSDTHHGHSRKRKGH